MADIKIMTIDGNKAMVAKSPVGNDIINAFIAVVNATSPNDIAEIGHLVRIKPNAIKKALAYKNYL